MSHLFAVAATAQDPGPSVTISLRGVVDGTAEQGEPWRVAVRIEAPAEATAPFELVPDGGKVVECISIELRRAPDNVIAVTARPADAAGPSRVVLDQEHIVTGIGYFSAGDMARVGPGEYLVQARLVVRGSKGWSGTAASRSVAVKVVAATNDPRRASAKAVARAHDSLFAGDPAEAARQLDAVLAQNPDDLEVLAVRAGLSMRGGNQRVAKLLVARAIMIAARPGFAEPPVELYDLEERINAGKEAAEPPAWTIPPDSVFGRVTR